MQEKKNLSYDTVLEQSKQLDEQIQKNPKKFRALSGDRPTGKLHIGHYFGSLKNRVRLLNLGVPTMILIADYQVLTDHDSFDKISQNTRELVLDYLSIGISPENGAIIYPHSQIPECNQLMLPFLTLVSTSELERNPTVKDEIESAKIKHLNAGMLTYPVHQACDILFCKANVVPVGKDQIPHLEMCRTIARRFNEKFCPKNPIFPEPKALLSETPLILGLDGAQKMSKSLKNAIFISSTEDETANAIKKAKTDSERFITYDPDSRPEVANLLRILSLCTNKNPNECAVEIGNGGAGMLKKMLTEALNETLFPIRKKRQEFEKDFGYVQKILLEGAQKAREVACKTLSEVRSAMNMEI